MTERDTSLDHRSLEWAVEIIGMCEPICCIQGGMWFGRNHNFADATFVDYGAADAFAVAAKALPDLIKQRDALVSALTRAREAVNAIVLSTHSISFDADLRAIDEALATPSHHLGGSDGS